MSELEHLTLANLPSDIIRLIIKADEDSVDGVRLVSPRWNVEALEHISARRAHTVIKRCLWELWDAYTILGIEIHKKDVKFLGVEAWSVLRFARKNDMVYLQTKVRDAENLSVRPKIDKFLKRCSHIKQFELEIWSTSNLQTVEFLLKNMKNIVVDLVFCERLSIFDYKAVNFVLKFSRSASVQGLVLRTHNPIEHVGLLQHYVTEASQFVPNLDFFDCDNYSFDTFEDMRDFYQKFKDVHFPNLELIFENRVIKRVRFIAKRN